MMKDIHLHIWHKNTTNDTKTEYDNWADYSMQQLLD